MVISSYDEPGTVAPAHTRQIAGARIADPRDRSPRMDWPHKAPPEPGVDYEAPGLERIGGAGLSAGCEGVPERLVATEDGSSACVTGRRA
jgi:hypothetical protein